MNFIPSNAEKLCKSCKNNKGGLWIHLGPALALLGGGGNSCIYIVSSSLFSDLTLLLLKTSPMGILKWVRVKVPRGSLTDRVQVACLTLTTSTYIP